MTAGDADGAGATDAASARRRLGAGAVVVLVVAALAVTVGIGIVRGALAPVDQVVVDTTPSASAEAASELYVHVSGAVRAPGLYVLPTSARAVDAIAAAGGFADDADRGAVNLARALDDGEQLAVPRQGETPAAPAGPAAATGAADAPLDLNTADAAQLETLPRIGPALAERIVAWRDDNGGFTSVEDLLAVPGIGDKMLESLRDLVTV
ncbi:MULTISPECIES: helix-hairpin-helix domain-containing protein [Microbacterium]|uniref:ComEA family DNA-binding protein n=1 Tax=Microbacterium TaxID=33882 RepID=UPI000D644D6A|nr:helix-hairpin-helix domain-containing protein [Microbacterium sp. KCTC 39802]